MPRVSIGYVLGLFGSDGSQGNEKASEVTMSQGKTSPTAAAAHGKVVAIEQHPQQHNWLLVGFADGHIVLYDLESKVSQRKFLHPGQVTSWSMPVHLTFAVAFLLNSLPNRSMSVAAGDDARGLAVQC